MKMNIAKFQNSDDLMNFFQQHGKNVGPRVGPNKRTDDQMEMYNLRQYLLTLGDNNLLQYPISVEKGPYDEINTVSPDFIITKAGGSRRGLEVTQATTNDWQQELANLDSKHDLKNDELDKVLISSLGRGTWVGDSPEKETCDAILRAIIKKAEKIRGGKYFPLPRYDLLIYVNVRAFFYNNNELIGLLRNYMSCWQKQWSFLGRVNVISSEYLLFDFFKDFKKLELFGWKENL